MRVLLTNDDGIDAPGLVHLYAALSSLEAVSSVTVVAPASVQSAMSHAVTFHKPVRVRRRVVEHDGGSLFEGYAVEGRPADCVKLALAHLAREVDVVVSGMNSGANVGVNVLYSGTVAAAREAAFVGVPAVAVSLHVGDWDRIRWPDAARHGAAAVDAIARVGVRPHGFVNVNVPILDNDPEPRGVKVVPISDSPLLDAYEADQQPDGSVEFTVNSSIAFRSHPAGSDVHWLYEGYVTVSPMHFESHDMGELDRWRRELTPTGAAG